MQSERTSAAPDLAPEWIMSFHLRLLTSSPLWAITKFNFCRSCFPTAFSYLLKHVLINIFMTSSATVPVWDRLMYTPRDLSAAQDHMRVRYTKPLSAKRQLLSKLNQNTERIQTQETNFINARNERLSFFPV